MELSEHLMALYAAHEKMLTPRQFEVLWLRNAEGLSGKEISYRLGISQSAVSRHLTRADAKIMNLHMIMMAEHLSKEKK